jgi:hypothetical protein
MITNQDSLERSSSRADRSAPVLLRQAPPLVPATKIVRYKECDGEAPIEALRNSAIC